MAKRQLDLLVEDTKDSVARENFDRIRQFITGDLFSKFDGGFYELTFEAAVTHFRFPHQLRFVPKDVIQTSKIGAGTVTFNYTLFSTTHLDITTSGAAIIRFVAGSFKID